HDTVRGEVGGRVGPADVEADVLGDLGHSRAANHVRLDAVGPWEKVSHASHAEGHRLPYLVADAGLALREKARDQLSVRPEIARGRVHDFADLQVDLQLRKNVDAGLAAKRLAGDVPER